MQKVEGAASPARQLGHQYGIDFAPLSKRHHLLPLGAIELRARAGFFEHASHVVAGACGKSRQIALLPGAGLIGGGDPAIKGRLLSQLNSPRLAGSKSLIPCGRAPYRTAFTLSGTIRYAETPCADHHTARRAVHLAYREEHPGPVLDLGRHRSRSDPSAPARSQSAGLRPAALCTTLSGTVVAAGRIDSGGSAPLCRRPG